MALVAAGPVLLPLYSELSGNIFILTLFTRIIIFALAARQPQSHHGLWRHDELWPCRLSAASAVMRWASSRLRASASGFIQWPVALVASALLALVIGALEPRRHPRRHIIMITLAFREIAYYVASGLSRYGGDDGLTIYKRSTFGGLIDLSNRVQFYYLCLAACSAASI